MLVLEEEHGIITANRRAQQAVGIKRSRWIDDSQAGDLCKGGNAGLRVINGSPFQITTNRNTHDYRSFPFITRAPAEQRELISNLVHRRPDIVEELDLNNRLQAARSHSDRATYNVCLGQW